MDLKGKKVLVTGAAGFIASHLVEELVSLGADVRAFIRYKSDSSIGNLMDLPQETLKKIEIIRGDIKNIEIVKEATKDIDVIFHLSAQISVPHSYKDPRDFVETNILGTLNILKAAHENDVKKIIITSSSEVYGTAKYTPIDEEHPSQPQSPYAASKISADKLAESFYKTYGLPVAIIRPFNTYGPRQSTRAVIPTIISQALTKDKIKIGSLTPKRDFNYVKDTVNGFIKIAESENSIGETINVGTGQAVSIGEVIETVEKILGRKLAVETDDNRIRPENSEVKILLCNNAKAKKLIGWEPKFSLEDGLKEVVDYIKNNPNKYNLEGYNI